MGQDSSRVYLFQQLLTTAPSVPGSDPRSRAFWQRIPGGSEDTAAVSQILKTIRTLDKIDSIKAEIDSVKIKIGLESIQLKFLKKPKGQSSIHFPSISLLADAYAASEDPLEETRSIDYYEAYGKFLAFLAMFMLFLTSLLIVFFSTDTRKVEYAKDMIKLCSGFFIGLLTGKA